MASSYDISGQDPAMDERSVEIVTTCLQEFSQQNLWRNTTAAHWEEIAELIDPASRNTFYYGNYNWPGQKKTDRQVDATGMVSLGRGLHLYVEHATFYIAKKRLR